MVKDFFLLLECHRFGVLVRIACTAVPSSSKDETLTRTVKTYFVPCVAHSGHFLWKGLQRVSRYEPSRLALDEIANKTRPLSHTFILYLANTFNSRGTPTSPANIPRVISLGESWPPSV